MRLHDLEAAFITVSGVPYSAYSSFHEFMASISDPDFEVTLIPKFVPSVPGLQEQLGKSFLRLRHSYDRQ